MARQPDDVMGGLRRQFKRQLCGLPHEAKRHLTGFGREAVHQLGNGWAEKFARQIFRPSPRPRLQRGDVIQSGHRNPGGQ